MKKLTCLFLFFIVIFLSTPLMASMWLAVEKNGNVRSGPGMKYPIVGKVNFGDIIEVESSGYFKANETVIWYPIEAKKNKTEEIVIGWFLERDLNVDLNLIIGQQMLFFKESKEDGREGRLNVILPGKKIIPYVGICNKGKFVTTKTIYTKWVHSSLVKLTGNWFAAFDYIGHQRKYLSRKEQINKLNVSDELKKIINEKKIRRGMTDKQVLLSWGDPSDKNSSVGSYGRHEQWIYNIGDFKSDYLYFENGILTSYQLSGR